MRNKHILFSTVSCMIIFSFEVGAQCVMTQDCTALGYTKTEAECSGNNGVKCPFGNKWYCPTKPMRVCPIGWIYYSDNTCSLDVVSGKLALGVVVYVNADGIGGQVMAVKSIGSMVWSKEYVDIPSLPNLSRESASTDYNSCTNTDKIVAYGDRTRFPAAWAARGYAPTTETKGKWCLPAAGIMTSIYNNQATVKAGIAKLGGTTFSSCCTWSSSEFNFNASWYSYLSGSYGLGYNYDEYDANTVRPVLEF